MRNKLLFSLAVIGLLAGVFSAHVASLQKEPPPPVFSPAPDPYAQGIYANGIIESYQANGANINLYPEVAGVITEILVSEGQRVKRGTPLLTIDDSVQRANVAQLQSQAQAAFATLEALQAQPRKETLAVYKAQVEAAAANVKSAEDQYTKQLHSYEIAPESVSKDVLDNARNATKVAQANLEVARRQYELSKAGAWSYDIKNQEKQYEAFSKAYDSASALLAKYTIRAPVDGEVMAIKAAVGSYISAQGTYDTYSQGYSPVMVMSTAEAELAVRCFIDEILIHKLPQGGNMRARMFIRGTSISVPLQFVRLQPYVTPKIELSNALAERVDVRVLPVIFRFDRPKDVELYPGQLVDVYVEGQEVSAVGRAPPKERK